LIEKIRRLLKDSFIYGLERYLAAFAGVFLVPVYTRIFAPDDYGVIEIISTIISMVFSFAVLGLDSALAFYFYDAKNEGERRILSSSSFIFRLGFIVLLVVILFAAAGPVSGWFLKSSGDAVYLKIAFLTLPFTVITNFCLDLLRFRLKPLQYSIVSLGITLTGICLSVYLVVFLRWGFYGVFGAQVITGCIFAMVSLWMNRQHVSFAFSTDAMKKMLKYGLPLVPAGASLWITSFSDRFFITHYCSLHEVGLYSIGYKLSMLLSLVTAAFQMAWGPFAFSIKDEPDARDFYAAVLTYYYGITTFCALILSVFSREILLVFTTDAYADGYRVVGILVFSVIFTGVYYIFAIGVNLTRKTAHIGWTNGVAAGLNVILNVILVPRYGIIGAAVSGLSAQLVSAGLLYFISQRVFPVQYEMMKIGKITLLAAACIVFGMNTGIVWLKIGVVLLYPVLLLSLKIMKKSEMLILRDALFGASPLTRC
jgi:O-antigen/teichoic acid export membrane protein